MTAPSGTLRLFVAVLLPEGWIAALAEAQEALRRAGLRLRYVRPEAIHLTLKFLGEVERGRLGTVSAALGGPAAELRPFPVRLDALGAFGPADGDLPAARPPLQRLGLGFTQRDGTGNSHGGHPQDDLPPAMVPPAMLLLQLQP